VTASLVSVGLGSVVTQTIRTSLGGLTRAGVTSGAILRGTTLSVTATSTNDTRASVDFTGVSLVGGNATTLSSDVSQDTTADAGGAIPLTGAATLTAHSTTHSVSENSNVSVGAIALNLMDVQASLGGSTMAGIAAGASYKALSLTATATGDAVAS